MDEERENGELESADMVLELLLRQTMEACLRAGRYLKMHNAM